MGRELGFSEVMYNVLLYRTGMMGIYCHVRVFDSTAEVTNEQFIEAFRVLVNCQPFLRMKIRSNLDSEHDPRQYFEPIPAEDVINIKWVNMLSSGEWTDIMEIEKNANIHAETGPLWRTITGKVTKTQAETSFKFPSETNRYTYQLEENGDRIQQKWEYVIVFYIHHGVVEAVSCFDLICNQFLPVLNNNNHQPPDDIFKKLLPLPPTIESALLGETGPNDFRPPWYVRAISFAMEESYICRHRCLTEFEATHVFKGDSK